jgi:hypothetical protein
MEGGLTISRKMFATIVVVLLLVAGVATCSWRAAEEKRRAEEIATAQGIARVLASTFAGKTDLRVASVNGTIDVTSVNNGTIFQSKLNGTLPFSVDYFVDLSGLTLDDAKYDPATKRLLVTIPDVRVADPNIDLTRGKMGDAEGWWVSRQASQALVTRSVKLADRQAEDTAKEPENLAKARTEGRARVAKLLELPLEASGIGDIDVEVRYASEGRPTDERWDVSRSVKDVLDEAAARRAGETN